jgi:hypothetical protein
MALVYDHLECGRHTAEEFAAKVKAIVHEEGLLRAMAELARLLAKSSGGIQYVGHVEGDGAEMFAAVCKLGIEGIVSKKLSSPLPLGQFQVLDQVAQSEGAGVDAGGGWELLNAPFVQSH